MRIDVGFREIIETFTGFSEQAEKLTVNFGQFQTVTKDREAFDGAYEYTPTQFLQIVDIGQKYALQNITINPIPSNYGLITWNGAVLTVS